MLVMRAFLCDIEEWIAQGWYVSQGFSKHPVMARYGTCYVWKEVD